MVLILPIEWFMFTVRLVYINATFVATVFVETKHGEKGKESGIQYFRSPNYMLVGLQLEQNVCNSLQVLSGDAVLPLSLPEKNKKK